MTDQPISPEPEAPVFTLTHADLVALIEERRQVTEQVQMLGERLRLLHKKVAAAERLLAWAKEQAGMKKPGASE